LPLTALLLGKKGVLYGTTSAGGTGACSSPSGYPGCGVVFRLTPSGSQYTEKILYSFQGGRDGEAPRATLVQDSSANLYGTTDFGGISNSACRASPSGNTTCGTVFELSPSGKETILYRFKGGKRDGSGPRAALTQLPNGSFVGVTLDGGSTNIGPGTVYELTPTSGKYRESVIHFFGTSGDGDKPLDADGLTLDSNGDLFGTTIGSTVSPCGCGVVFELTPTSSGYSEQVLHVFNGAGDGANPRSSVALHNGTLYGTTYNGGAYCDSSSYGCGVVYKVK
jgi:uncharacterized repeat protein (TIGR03803 family)